jgi:hypothetical protein
MTDDPTPSIARYNHSVPRAYLRAWSDDGAQVWARRLLVPHAQYPEWEKRPIRGLAVYEDLYTSVRTGADTDDMEHWLNDEFENPAAPALERVRAGLRPSSNELRSLVLYVAALDLRTPAAYAAMMERTSEQLPEVINSVFEGLKRDLREAARQGRKLEPRNSTLERPPMHVSVAPVEGKKELAVTVEAVADREMWLHSMRHLLSRTADVLCRHDWAFMRPAHGSAWITSDHPVLKLNFASASKYDFGGGWDRKGGEIIVALSPEILMYTRMGFPAPANNQFSGELTRLLQRFLAERAHRWIVANRQSLRAVVDRRRTIDLEAFTDEENVWKRWHAEQSEAHRALGRGSA